MSFEIEDSLFEEPDKKSENDCLSPGSSSKGFLR